jgi:hypothetical protein
LIICGVLGKCAFSAKKGRTKAQILSGMFFAYRKKNEGDNRFEKHAGGHLPL